MRTITVERGYDPREFTLVAFGGMGPTIAGLVAAELGIGRILVPRDPGTFSAWGMLVTDVQQENSLTRITPLEATTPGRTRGGLSRASRTAPAPNSSREGFAPRDIAMLRHAGMRYRGQSYEVSVAVPPSGGGRTSRRRWRAASTRRITAATATWPKGEPVEIVNFARDRRRARSPSRALRSLRARSRRATAAGTCARGPFRRRGRRSVPVYRRADLAPGMRIAGPAIIEEQTSTTVLHPGQNAAIDGYLDIEIEVG